jgi:hypothetical protein
MYVVHLRIKKELYMISIIQLDYTDDICLLSHSQAHMQSKLNNLWYGSKKVRLEINFSKTEELRVNTISQRSIMLANKGIRRVHDFT